jgi:hypothetical protein
MACNLFRTFSETPIADRVERTFAAMNAAVFDAALGLEFDAGHQAE